MFLSHVISTFSEVNELIFCLVCWAPVAPQDIKRIETN